MIDIKYSWCFFLSFMDYLKNENNVLCSYSSSTSLSSCNTTVVICLVQSFCLRNLLKLDRFFFYSYSLKVILSFIISSWSWMNWLYFLTFWNFFASMNLSISAYRYPIPFLWFFSIDMWRYCFSFNTFIYIIIFLIISSFSSPCDQF